MSQYHRSRHQSACRSRLLHTPKPETSHPQTHLHPRPDMPRRLNLRRCRHRSCCRYHRKFPLRLSRLRANDHHSLPFPQRILQGSKPQSYSQNQRHLHLHQETILEELLHRCRHRNHCLSHRIFQEQRDRKFTIIITVVAVGDISIDRITSFYRIGFISKAIIIIIKIKLERTLIHLLSQLLSTPSHTSTAPGCEESQHHHNLHH